MDAFNRMEIDPLNRLSGFRSSIRVANLPQEIVLQGVVDGSRLKLRVDAGDLSYTTEHYMPRNALIGDELSPLARLPGLHVGQSWTIPVYNPLRLPDGPMDSPMEILQATVESHERLLWNGESIDTLLVVYRADSGSAFGTARRPRGKMWIDESGAVLRQEMNLLGSKLAFVRRPADDSPANDRREIWQRALRHQVEAADRDSADEF